MNIDKLKLYVALMEKDFNRELLKGYDEQTRIETIREWEQRITNDCEVTGKVVMNDYKKHLEAQVKFLESIHIWKEKFRSFIDNTKYKLPMKFSEVKERYRKDTTTIEELRAYYKGLTQNEKGKINLRRARHRTGTILFMNVTDKQVLMTRTKTHKILKGL